jgi:phosphomannomutase
LHYGRDALVGIGLFLSYLAKSSVKCLELRRRYPEYVIAKKKLSLQPGTDFDKILDILREEFKGRKIDERDGMWIEYPKGWLQVRKSNTEPIMRIYAEAGTQNEADNLADRVIAIVKNTYF